MQPTAPNSAASLARAPRLAVLLSGGGRTLLNLCDRIQAGSLHATIPLVIADRDCAGLDRARARGLHALRIPGVMNAEVLRALCAAHSIDWIVLAGYLRMVRIPRGYETRVVNIHPSLLPKFGGPGMHGHKVHEAVLAAGESESGATVHLCDAHFDTGPVVLQGRCPVLPGDTPDSLAARVFAVECELLPAALTQLFSRRET